MQAIHKLVFVDVGLFTDADDPRLNAENHVPVGSLWWPPATVAGSNGHILVGHFYQLDSNVYDPDGEDPIDYTEWVDIRSYPNLFNIPVDFTPKVHSRNGPAHKDRLLPQNYVHYLRQPAHLQAMRLAEVASQRKVYFK